MVMSDTRNVIMSDVKNENKKDELNTNRKFDVYDFFACPFFCMSIANNFFFFGETDFLK
jgi:hypothetical protein